MHVTQNIREIIQKEDDTKWQIKKVGMQLIATKGPENRIKHEQLLREHRLY